MLEPMAPDKKTTPRNDYEVAWHTAKSGRPPRRKLLQRRTEDFPDSTITAANHHSDESSSESKYPIPREDRAG